MGSNHEKIWGQKSHDTLPLKVIQIHAYLFTELTKTESGMTAELTGVPVNWVGASSIPPIGKRLRPQPWNY